MLITENNVYNSLFLIIKFVLLTLNKTKMKKIILSVVAVFAFGFANAQDVPAGNGFSKGDKFVEGALVFVLAM